MLSENYASPTIPPAPRAPVFARTAAPGYAPTPRSYAPPYGSYDPYSSRSYNPNVPAAPSSLAPVAMYRHAADTGSLRAQETIIVRDPKPSMRWGIMIAVAGAMIGGLLGIAMNAKNGGEARAAAAAAPQQEAAPPQAAPPPAPQQPGVLGATNVAPAVATAAAPAAPVVAPPNAKDAKDAKADKDKADKDKDKADKAEHAKKQQPHRYYYAAPAAKPADKPEKAEKAEKPTDKTMVASKVPEPKTDKAEKKDSKAADKTGETGAAVKALSDAQKETSLSLGGSR